MYTRDQIKTAVENKGYKYFEESDWNDWFRFNKNKSYADNVK